MKLDLSEQEAQSLVELLDVATKAGGLNAARHALPLVERIMAAAQADKEPSGNGADIPEVLAERT